MNHPDTYSKELIDEKFKAVHVRFSSQDTVLTEILTQTKKTNGRVTRMERIMLVVGTAIVILLIVNGSSLVQFFETITK